MRTRTRKTFIAACGLAAGALLALSACTSDGSSGARYETDYSGHEPLRVFGYPSAGSLRAVQEVVWRLADGEAGELAKLATGDGEPRPTAANWVKGFRAGARGRVSADFYDEASERQVVVLYFRDTGQVKELSLRVDGDSGWRVLMDEADPEEAVRAPTWAPKEPGGQGSVSTG
ncbi:hypothetical protein ACIPPM_16680 [Streptomyces sp. NPDC090119]|uniref:hypothetical protein n=1 Tax=Streptomyces sp. NPDC090119 TaxID=3365951 RepID=UPI00382B00F7